MMQVLNGSLVALVTPMKIGGEIDFDALNKIIDWHIQQGTNGIVSVGTTGESATLNFEEHIEVIRHTINYVDGRLPVIAGTGANSTSEALDWIKLLLIEDMNPLELKKDSKDLLPKLHGALIKNEQDIHLFEKLVFMSRGQN